MSAPLQIKQTNMWSLRKRELIQLVYVYYILSMESKQVFTKIFMLVVWALMRFMMTSSNGNIFRVTGYLCGEFTGDFRVTDHLCGEITGPLEVPAQMPVTQSFDVFFDLRLNKRLSKQSWGWWFETLSRPLWRHCNVVLIGTCWIYPCHFKVIL